MHISEQVLNELKNQHWLVEGNEATKHVLNFAEPGMFSNGDRIVRLTINETGRYLSRVDGWGNIDKDVDLRNFSNPNDAINAVMQS